MQAEPTTKPEKQTLNVPVGIAGVSMKEDQRAVGANEPPPLAINEKLSVIGKDAPRLDGKLKVTGAAK